jgi:Flp pilus assembly protein TadG
MKHRRTNPLRDRRGATAIEAAIAMPVFLVLILGITELGSMLWTLNSAQYVADMLSRCYAIGSCTSSNGGTKAYNSPGNVWPDSGSAGSAIATTLTSCGTSGAGSGVRVTVTVSRTNTPLAVLGGYLVAAAPSQFPDFVAWPFTQLSVASCYPM